jgi:hypothetical protein
MHNLLTITPLTLKISYLPETDDNDMDSVSDACIGDVSQFTMLYIREPSPTSQIPSNDVSKRMRQLSITDNANFLLPI